MINSMTGFGSSVVSNKAWEVKVELKSINNRFLDIQIRMPAFLNPLEQKIRHALHSKIARGKISVNIHCDRKQAEGDVQLDQARVEYYYKLFSAIKKKYRLAGEVDLNIISRQPDIFKKNNGVVREQDLWPLLNRSLAQALAKLVLARVSDGKAHIKDFNHRFIKLKKEMEHIEKRAPQRITLYKRKMQERLNTLLAGGEVEPARFNQEIYLMAEKLDITEECVRFNSHLKEFRETIRKGGSVGNKLNFLLQELNREANTICSKANDTVIGSHGIILKEEIEKIREQVQNIA